MLPNIFLYIDYRYFLSDMYHGLRARNHRFSTKGFGRMVGWHSGDFLNDLLDRTIDIDPSTISTIARRFEFNDTQKTYFELIVSFDQAKTHHEKDHYFRRIVFTREYGPPKELTQQQYEYFSHWYNPVIRELIVHPEYEDDPEWISKQIIPQIDVSSVKDSIRLLESLDLISRDEIAGKWMQCDKVVSTSSEVLSVAITRYHQDVIALGKSALEQFDISERDIRSVTMGIPHSAYNDVKIRFEAFWKELLEFAGTHQVVERVYQVNMQLFPLSRGEDCDENS